MSGVLRLSNSVTGRSTIIASASNDQTFTLPALGGTLLAGGSSLEVIFPSGSEALPGLHVQGDTDTGLYAPAANTLGISTAGSERLRIDSSGNVGIGNTAMSALADNDANDLVVGPGNANAGITVYTGTGNYGSLTFADGTSGDQDYRGSVVYHHSGDSMRFNTAASERLRIDSSGDVGIGTSSPGGYKLHVAGNVLIGQANSLLFGSSSGPAPKITNSGQENSLSFFTNGSESARIDSSGNVGIGTTSPVNSANFNTLQLGNGTSTGGQIALKNTTNQDFYLWHDGNGVNIYNQSATSQIFYNGAAERMRIDSSGRLLVGTSSSIDTSSLIQAVKASGTSTITVRSGSLSNNDSSRVIVQTLSPANRFAQFAVAKHSNITNPVAYAELNQEDGNQSFFWFDNSAIARTSPTFNHTGTTNGTVIGTQTSDERLKNVGANVAYGLAEVKRLQPKQYTLKTEPDTNKLGFIAQEVESIIPEAVFNTRIELTGHQKGDQTQLGMEYVQLIPVLVNAIKELSSKVETLEQRLSNTGIA